MSEGTPAQVSPEMARAAVEWQAQEAADARKVDGQIAAMEAPAAQPAAEPQNPAEVQAQQMAAALEGSLGKLCTVAWTILDAQVVRFAGAELALTAEERAQLAEASVPVINKYLPQVMAQLLGTPEGMLLMTAGIIYGGKLVLPDAKPTAPAPAAPPAPTQAATA